MLEFGNMKFILEKGKRARAVYSCGESPIAECVLAGQNKLSRDGKRIPTAEGEALKYVSHEIDGDVLQIVQESETIRSTVRFRKYEKSNAMRVSHVIHNISAKEVCVNQVSAFVAYGIDGNSIADLKRVHFYRFYNSWHCECQPQRASLFESGLYSDGWASFSRVYGSNKGSWSTKEELPQLIIEYGDERGFSMAQIESANHWYWEIGECAQGIYFYAGGADAWSHDWACVLAPDESYETPSVAVSSGKSLNDVIAEMTVYRRNQIKTYVADASLPVIFNEYMHLSWDSPEEERTREIAPVAASLGADIYVIDCGWHNEEDGNVIYPYVGQWRESKKRFAHGVRKTVDYIHGLGMKAGLWLEPEIVGYLCEEMTRRYPEKAFFSNDGTPVIVGGRRFLDYRCPQVVDYMNETVDRVVREYGADYLKFDYNQDCGCGTDGYGEKPGRGLELATEAFFRWVEHLREKYPALIIEGCASGGQRMDYRSTAEWALISSSDQTDYKKYPWIVGNILSAVLPEQAGIWSYPVDSWVKDFRPTEKWVQTHVSEETVAMNMVTALMGRLHLSSHVELLGEGKKDIVREGVEYFKRTAAAKKKSVPYFPKGFSRFGDGQVAAGFIAENKLYLAVWNTGGRKRDFAVDVSEIHPLSCKLAFPLRLPTDFSFEDGKLTVRFGERYQARFFEFELV